MRHVIIGHKLLRKTLLVLHFWCHLVKLKISTNQFLAARRENFCQIIFSNRYFSCFKEVYGAPRFGWCAVTVKCAPSWRVAKISMRHFRKRCAMAHMAQVRIIPAYLLVIRIYWRYHRPAVFSRSLCIFTCRFGSCQISRIMCGAVWIQTRPYSANPLYVELMDNLKTMLAIFLPLCVLYHKASLMCDTRKKKYCMLKIVVHSLMWTLHYYCSICAMQN